MHHPQDITGLATKGSSLDIASITYFLIFIGLTIFAIIIYFVLKKRK